MSGGWCEAISATGLVITRESVREIVSVCGSGILESRAVAGGIELVEVAIDAEPAGIELSGAPSFDVSAGVIVPPLEVDAVLILGGDGWAVRATRRTFAIRAS